MRDKQLKERTRKHPGLELCCDRRPIRSIIQARNMPSRASLDTWPYFLCTALVFILMFFMYCIGFYSHVPPGVHGQARAPEPSAPELAGTPPRPSSMVARLVASSKPIATGGAGAGAAAPAVGAATGKPAASSSPPPSSPTAPQPLHNPPIGARSFTNVPPCPVSFPHDVPRGQLRDIPHGQFRHRDTTTPSHEPHARRRPLPFTVRLALTHVVSESLDHVPFFWCGDALSALGARPAGRARPRRSRSPARRRDLPRHPTVPRAQFDTYLPSSDALLYE